MDNLQGMHINKIKNNKKISIKKLIYLLFIFLILSTSTYAWLTTNTFVKVESLEINVETSNGLEISVDALNWKTVLTHEDVITGGDWDAHSNHIPGNKDVKAVSTIGEPASLGRLRMFYGHVDVDFALGDAALITTELTDELSTKEYIAFDIFLKSDYPCELNLDIDANVISAPNAIGYTKGLENATRVGFVNNGQIDMRTYKTPSGVNYARSLHSAEQVVIWEPNSDSHTTAAINSAYNAYGVSIGMYDVISSYSGVKNTITKPIGLKDTNFIAQPNYFGEVRASMGSTFSFIQTPKPLKNDANYRKGQPLYYMNLGGEGLLDNPANLGINISPGVIKIRVYMWIEGQDYDCEDFAPGTDLQFNLSFTTAR